MHTPTHMAKTRTPGLRAGLPTRPNASQTARATSQAYAEGPGRGQDAGPMPADGAATRAAAGSDEESARRIAAQALSRPASALTSKTAAHGAPPSSGHSLEPVTRAAMESRFGHNFADVRVFTDQTAAESARGLGADAYTYGRSIAFAPGRYAPHSELGRSLIAHELAHVVQQRNLPPRVQRQKAGRVEVFDRDYLLDHNPGGTNFRLSTGRYELSDADLAHLVRRGGFYFLVTSSISLITPPEVRLAMPAGKRGSGVLLQIGAADYASVPAAPDATVAKIVQDKLGITVPKMTHASGPDRDFSRPELPAPMAHALQQPGSIEGASARGKAAQTSQERTLELAARRGEELPIHEIAMADLMDQSKILKDMAPAARADWYVQKLGSYQAQLYVSAQRHHLPTQLLAVVILNELADINIVDVVQSGERAQFGSLGIAQIQVDTARAENLVDVSPAEAEAAYREAQARIGHDHDPGHPLNAFELQAGHNLRIGRQLQVPQVAIEAAAREIEILINRMASNRGSPWQTQFNFRAGGCTGDAIYDAVGPQNASQEVREGMLAMMVSGAYNSPNVIDTGKPEGFRNALVHGNHARSHAIYLNRYGLFRSAGAAPQAAASAAGAAPRPAAAAPRVSGMRFDGSRLTLYGGAAAASFAALSGLRPNNPANHDKRDHTGPGSQGLEHVGPIPEGSYFVNPGQVQRTGFDAKVWGPLRVPIVESVSAKVSRVWGGKRTGGFYVHQDVRRDGTAGCIGLQTLQDTVTVFARFGATIEQIPLDVRYPRTGGAVAPPAAKKHK